MTRPSDLTKGSVFQKYWRRLRKTADDIHNDYADIKIMRDKRDSAQAADQMKAAIALTLIEDDDSLRFEWEGDEQDCEPPEFDKGKKGEKQHDDWVKRHEEGEYVFYSLRLVKTFLDAEGNMDHDEAVDSLYCIEIAVSRRGGRTADRDYKFLSFEAEMAENYLYTTYGSEWWRPFVPERFANIELPDFDLRPMWERQRGTVPEAKPVEVGNRKIELDDAPRAPKLSRMQQRDPAQVAARLVGQKIQITPSWIWRTGSIANAKLKTDDRGRPPAAWNRFKLPSTTTFRIVDAARLNGTFLSVIAYTPSIGYVPLLANTVWLATHGSVMFMMVARADTTDRQPGAEVQPPKIKLVLSHRERPASYKRPIELDGLSSLRFWELR